MGYSPWGCKDSDTTEHSHSLYIREPLTEITHSGQTMITTCRSCLTTGGLDKRMMCCQQKPNQEYKRRGGRR